MPERFPVQPPTATTAKQNVIAGTNTFSGTPNTGQVLFTLGASMNDSRTSGSTADIQLWTGAGRLDFIQLVGAGATVPQAASGFPIFFYDSHNAASGGPVINSGPKILAVLDARAEAAKAGGFFAGFFNSGAPIFSSVPYAIGTVFTSGLCVSQRSGQPGFVAGWTPVVSA